MNIQDFSEALREHKSAKMQALEELQKIELRQAIEAGSDSDWLIWG